MIARRVAHRGPGRYALPMAENLRMHLASRTDRLPVVVLALGAVTVVSAVAAMIFLATYEGVGLIGYRTAGAAAASALCFVLAVTGFIVATIREQRTVSAVLGFCFALGALPVAMATGIVFVLVRMALGLE